MKPKNHSKKINFLFFREVKENRTFLMLLGFFFENIEKKRFEVMRE
jgi:hypothetical protein